MKRNTVTRLFACTLVSSMLLSVPAYAENTEPVTISLYPTASIDDLYASLIEEFEALYPNITVEYIPYDSSEKEKWMSLYAGGQGPTVAFLDPIDITTNAERMLPLDMDTDAWLQKIDSSLYGTYSVDGTIYGVPTTIAHPGLLYNKTTISEALGEEFDPLSITCRSDLEELFNKLEEKGVAGVAFTGVDWSLGSHYLGQVFAGVRGDSAGQDAFIEQCKNGEVDFMEDEAFMNIMDTFDMFAEHNYNAADPLIGNMELDAKALVDGDVAMWFMGSWAYSNLAAFDDTMDEYGIMPVPYTDNPDDEINQLLLSTAAKGYCVDMSQNDEAQQEAGKLFVEFLATNPDAVQVMADHGDECTLSDDSIIYNNCIINSANIYTQNGKIQDSYAYSVLPSDFWAENGSTMQAYLAKQIDRQTLADSLATYWQNQK